jgi:hypothetical protein
MTKTISSQEFFDALKIVKAYKKQISNPDPHKDNYIISDEYLELNLKEAGLNRRCINRITEVMLNEKIIQDKCEIIRISHLLKLPIHVFKGYRGVGAIMVYEVECVLNKYHNLTVNI